MQIMNIVHNTYISEPEVHSTDRNKSIYLFNLTFRIPYILSEWKVSRFSTKSGILPPNPEPVPDSTHDKELLTLTIKMKSLETIDQIRHVLNIKLFSSCCLALKARGERRL